MTFQFDTFSREKEIDEKLARMNVDLTAWKTRIDSRKRLAQKEIDKRTKILAEVRHFQNLAGLQFRMGI